MKKICLLIFLFIPQTLPAQILNDSAIQQLILNALDDIYSYDFAGASQRIRQIQQTYPQHPVGPTLKAIQLYWQYLPIRENRPAKAAYVQNLNQGLELAKRRLERDEDDPEGVFFALTTHGYLAAKHNFDNELLKAVGEAKKAYDYMKQGFTLTEKNAEFYFTTGLYNYYVERYPMDHPAVKPFMFFFQDGNMALGLRQMETAARRAVFTRVETAFYLAQIYLEHENQPQRAVAFLKPLADKYPDNPIFSLRTAEALILAGRYADAQPYVQRLKKMPQKVLQMPVRVLDAMLDERLEHNSAGAAAGYQNALKMPFDEELTREFHAHAYAGLARMAARTGNRTQARTYYKKVLDFTEYKSIRTEARMYLKTD